MWSLVQLSALVQEADERLLEALRTLGPALHAGLEEDTAIAIAPSAIASLQVVLGEIADLGDRMRVLVDGLPEEPLELRYEDLRDGAARDLASGMGEPARALLAARALDVADGWPALAEALRAGDAHADWHETTIATLLRRFRGASAELVDAVLADAGIARTETFASCDPERLDALALALEARAAGRR